MRVMHTILPSRTLAWSGTAVDNPATCLCSAQGQRMLGQGELFTGLLISLGSGAVLAITRIAALVPVSCNLTLWTGSSRSSASASPSGESQRQELEEWRATRCKCRRPLR